MSDSEAAGGPLVPLREQVVDFYGDQITGLLVQPGADPGAWYVPLRPLCEHLGLAWNGQFERTRRDPVLGPAVISVRVTRTEMVGRGHGSRTVIALPLEYLPGWLFGINASRVKPDLAEKITRYRRECFHVLWSAFQPTILPQMVPHDPRLVELAEQIDSLTGTLTFMREHMADIVAAAGAITDVSTRLDQAVNLLEALTHQQQALSVRQDVTEAQIERIDERTAHLTPAHKRQVQEFVEHMVQQTRDLPQPLQYGQIYGRVKSRYRVGSYVEVPDEAFDDLMEYLQALLRHVTSGRAPEQGKLF